MGKWAAWAGQALCYGLFALVLAAFSSSPAYRHLRPDQALLKLSFTHAAQLKVPCRRRGAEELAKLPPNMRNPMDCPRERATVGVELLLDGAVLTSRTVPPSGLSRDGPATLYARYALPAGPHRLEVRFKDSDTTPGFTHRRVMDIAPRAGQIMVVDFNAEQGGIVIQ